MLKRYILFDFFDYGRGSILINKNQKKIVTTSLERPGISIYINLTTIN